MTARRLALTILCAAAGGAIAGPAGSAQALSKDPCVKKGRTTIATTSVARTFAKGSSLYVCYRANGKVTKLFESDGVYSGGAVQAFVGRFVAYDFTEVPACKENCPPGVEAESETTLVDAKSGRRVELYDGSAARVALTRRGSAAWLEGTAKNYELHVRDADPERVVDTGNISSGSLEVSAGKLRWTNAGTRKSIAFR